MSARISLGKSGKTSQMSQQLTKGLAVRQVRVKCCKQGLQCMDRAESPEHSMFRTSDPVVMVGESNKKAEGQGRKLKMQVRTT